MDKKFILSPGPHVFKRLTTQRVMRNVVISLIPAMLAALYLFRIQAVKVLLGCIITCVLFEYLYQKLTRKKITINDYSAVVTGILLALILPPATPLWVCAIGSFTAIVLTKQLFGGLGFNIFNPALLGRAFLMAAFPSVLTTWTNPITLDVVTSATPLGLYKFEHVLTSTGSLFLGNISGSLGETSAIALIIGGVYLLYKKIIDHRIPLAYITTVAIIGFGLHTMDPDKFAPASFHILAGGLLLGAFFMATDYVTTPVTKKGRWVFGIGCGLVTMIIRIWGGLPEGVMYSIILMNAFTPLINRITLPRRYGT